MTLLKSSIRGTAKLGGNEKFRRELEGYRCLKDQR